MAQTYTLRLEVEGKDKGAKKALDGIHDGLKSAEKDAASFGAKFKSGLESAGSTLTDWGGKLTAGLTLPIIGIGAAAIKMSTDLNASMANVAALGVPAERVAQLKTDVQNIAIATGTSTELVAAGLYQVESAFGDTADTVKILDTNTRLAGAGLSTVEQAIALTSAVTKAWNDTSAEAVEHVGDLAIKTVALGQTTLPELADSIGGATAMAHALGISQEELFSQISAVAGVTGGTSEATTGLRATYQAVIKPTEDMAGALGIVTQQLAKQGKLVDTDLVGAWQTADAQMNKDTKVLDGLQNSLDHVNTKSAAGKKAAAELTKQIKQQEKILKADAAAVDEHAAALGPAIVQSVGAAEAFKLLADVADGDINVLMKMFSSVEATNTVLSLTGAQAEGSAKALDAMKNSSGSLTDAFIAQTMGINATGFTMKQLQVISSVLMQRLGDGLAPALGRVLQLALPLVDKALQLATAFSKMDPATQGWIVAIAGAAAAIGPLLAGAGFLLPVLGALAGPAGLIAAVVAGIGALVAFDVGGIRTGLIAGLTDLGTKLDELYTAGKRAFDAVGGGINGAVAALGATTGGTVTYQSSVEITHVEWTSGVDNLSYLYNATTAITWVYWKSEKLGNGSFVYNANAGILDIDWTGKLGPESRVAFSYNSVTGIKHVFWDEPHFHGYYESTTGIIDVDFGEGFFTTIYDVKAGIFRKTSVLWGAWTYDYDAGANVKKESVGWGLWSHEYNVGAKVETAESVWWGAYTKVYDVGAKVLETEILWGTFGKVYDVGANVTTFTIFGKPVKQFFDDLFAGLTIGFNKPDLTGLHKEDPARDITTSPEWVMKLLNWKPDLAELLGWSWPGIPGWLTDWKWPGIPGWLTSWHWPSIPSLSSDWWPDIPVPNWLSGLLNKFGGGGDAPGGSYNPIPDPNPGTGATGQSSWRGGPIWVGEKGPELIDLPRGGRVYTNQESMAMAAAGGPVAVYVTNHVYSDVDWETGAYKVLDVIRRKVRG